MNKSALLIGAAAAGIGLYFWTSGDWRRSFNRESSEPLPLPPIPPEMPGPLSMGAPSAQSQGQFAWLGARPEGVERFYPLV